ncbi:hypothetical protein [Thermostaphylospora chromogena]|uniref:Uncharacterized protein n=1 Tax=Thermostaphylospora chromogena TaxID=35622 RepID=A0A1H0ZTT1_9ACTN|nr:hypothetical protein [Thermostaphylospora chromogena]SDQ30446.1 hypothetical protein SAMN04489764_0123 [Thermostaphylospora chromogena]
MDGRAGPRSAESAAVAGEEGTGAVLIRLTARRDGGPPMPGSPIDGIRVMALLPAGWAKDLHLVAGDIVIRVRPDEPATSAQVRARVAEILACPEVGHLELVSCHALSAGHPNATSSNSKEETR